MYKPVLFMNIDLKVLNKIMTKSNSTLKNQYIMIKWNSFQICKVGSTSKIR